MGAKSKRSDLAAEFVRIIWQNGFKCLYLHLNQQATTMVKIVKITDTGFLMRIGKKVHEFKAYPDLFKRLSKVKNPDALSREEYDLYMRDYMDACDYMASIKDAAESAYKSAYRRGYILGLAESYAERGEKAFPDEVIEKIKKEDERALSDIDEKLKEHISYMLSIGMDIVEMSESTKIPIEELLTLI